MTGLECYDFSMGIKPGGININTFLRVLLILSCCPISLVCAAEDASPVLNSALARASQMPRLHSLLVSHQGELVVEQYFNGRDEDDIANVKSASKSIISALIGAAIDRGYLNGVDQTIGEFFPNELSGESNTAKREIKIEDLLTMQSGLETTSNRNYGRWVLSNNWIDFTLNQPLENTPGTVMQYSTGSTHLLSAIITKATGKSTLEFAREVLGQPLGFYLGAWPTDPQGIFFGGNDMEFTPKQMLRIGELYLNRGAYNGRQVLPAEWISATFVDRTISPRDEGRRTYGYGWWIRDMAGYRTTYAWGYGGQFILIVDELDLIIVTTSSSNPGSDRRRHTRGIYDLVEYDIIAPLARSTRLNTVSRQAESRFSDPSAQQN
ncbi:beta-lactamase family protein [Gammaproteobacteria bacterium]|nr:beta-lactamase family protein [Gammaproteobacteria bacterium]